MNTSNKDNISLNYNSNLSHLIFIYAFIYAFFHILPTFLKYEVQHRLMVADLFDLLTPFAMIFIIFKLYRTLLLYITDNLPKKALNRIKIIYISGAIIFIEGHGMHLSANAIARHLTSLQGTSLYILNYFFDEILSHILWDSGIIILSLAIIISGFYLKPEQKLSLKFRFIIPAALLYGFTYFVNAIEGQTVIFTLPVSIVMPLAILVYASGKKYPVMKNTVITVFFISYLVALGLFIFWYIWQGGFPEFSELGWI
jgi:hypothetical protein